MNARCRVLLFALTLLFLGPYSALADSSQWTTVDHYTPVIPFYGCNGEEITITRGWVLSQYHSNGSADGSFTNIFISEKWQGINGTTTGDDGTEIRYQISGEGPESGHFFIQDGEIHFIQNTYTVHFVSQGPGPNITCEGTVTSTYIIDPDGNVTVEPGIPIVN
jgi:hypothetical protein